MLQDACFHWGPLLLCAPTSAAVRSRNVPAKTSPWRAETASGLFPPLRGPVGLGRWLFRSASRRHVTRLTVKNDDSGTTPKKQRRVHQQKAEGRVPLQATSRAPPDGVLRSTAGGEDELNWQNKNVKRGQPSRGRPKVGQTNGERERRAISRLPAADYTTVPCSAETAKKEQSPKNRSLGEQPPPPTSSTVTQVPFAFDFYLISPLLRASYFTLFSSTERVWQVPVQRQDEARHLGS